MKGYFTRDGSIAEYTEQHRTAGIEVELEIHSSAAEKTIAELAWLAEDMCFVMQAIKNPVEAKLSLTLNGRPVGLPE